MPGVNKSIGSVASYVNGTAGQLRWMKVSTNVYQSKAYDSAMRPTGRYEIEKVYAPGPKGYGWYVTGPDWDGGYSDSLTEAKAACNAHHADK